MRKEKNIVLEIKEIILNYENNDDFINNIFGENNLNNIECSGLPGCIKDLKKLPDDFSDL